MQLLMANTSSGSTQLHFPCCISPSPGETSKDHCGSAEHGPELVSPPVALDPAGEGEELMKHLRTVLLGVGSSGTPPLS